MILVQAIVLSASTERKWMTAGAIYGITYSEESVGKTVLWKSKA